MTEALGSRKRRLEQRIRAREFVFGIQDGLISTVGLLSGVSAATSSTRLIVLTGVAAGVTGGLSMAAGSYLSARTEQEIFEKELLDQERLAVDEPHLAQEALLDSLVADGLDRPAAYRVVKTLATRQDVLLRTVQEKVLGLGAADLSHPVKASAVMFLSFMVGAGLPLLPYVLLAPSRALPVSWSISILTLLGVGIFKGWLTGKSKLVSGVEFAAVALGASVLGWLLGKGFDLLAGQRLSVM